MYTKIKNILFSFSCLLVASFVVVSCTDEETGVGYSTLNPNAGTSATITVTGGTSFTVNDGVDTEVPFTITLSQPQVVNVTFNVKQIAGDASEGSDFSLSASQIVIPAYSTSASGSIKILKDELAEDTETFTVQIGDEATANASVTPVAVDFTINNFTEGDLALNLSWSMPDATTDNSGAAIAPTDFVDMRLLLSSTPDSTGDIGEADGAGFENLMVPSDTPDGTYYVVADFYAGNDIARDLDLKLDLNQTGSINDESYNFPRALNSGISCSNIYYVMGKIVKVGESYTFESLGEKNPTTAAPFIGTATVLVDDWADDYVNDEIEIEAGSNPYEFYVRMNSNPYIDNPNTAYLIITIDPATGNVTGVSNEPWEYGNSTPVTATGSLDLCNKVIDLTLDYWYGMGTHYTGNQLKLQL